ncbi:MAG: UPF0175 family protein [Thermodesulfovibrionales bacterium]|jgi:predicted HTH domain antitoxin|nr:UPF0175 family protein [Thermodesulfovibrionales bacterium]
MILEKEIDALVKKGVYKDKEAIYTDALRFFFRYRPEIRIEAATELYKSKEVSLSKAAEIAGLDIESFKEELARRGLKIEIEAPDKEALEKGVSLLLGK